MTWPYCSTRGSAAVSTVSECVTLHTRAPSQTSAPRSLCPAPTKGHMYVQMPRETRRHVGIPGGCRRQLQQTRGCVPEAHAIYPPAKLTSWLADPMASTPANPSDWSPRDTIRRDAPGPLLRGLTEPAWACRRQQVRATARPCALPCRGACGMNGTWCPVKGCNTYGASYRHPSLSGVLRAGPASCAYL